MGVLMGNLNVDRSEWPDNFYGIDKEDYDNELDYMEAVEEEIFYSDEEDSEYYDGDDDTYHYDDDEDDYE